MSENQVSKKKIILIFVVTISLILALALLFHFNIKEDKVVTIKAEVKFIGDDYVIVESDDKDEYLLNLEGDYNKGDSLELTLDNITKSDDPISAEVKNVNVLSRNINFTIEDNDDSKTTTNENTQKTTQSTTDTTTTTTKNSKSESSKIVTTESDVINYFNDLDTSVDKSSTLTDDIKKNFISVVDFLFYGGKIKNKTFKELSTSGKLKVLKIAVSIDDKISSKYPDYKETLSSKYQDLKKQSLNKYLELTDAACSNNEDVCNSAKEGLTEMKKSFSLTWNFIKDMVGSNVSKLKDYYEIWRET